MEADLAPKVQIGSSEYGIEGGRVRPICGRVGVMTDRLILGDSTSHCVCLTGPTL